MKNRSIILLALLLTACGSTNSSSSEIIDTKTETEPIMTEITETDTDAAETVATVTSVTSSGTVTTTVQPETVDIDAEKYADIVKANENIWLDPLNNKTIQANETCECWFEDMDFDGEPEFVVGGFNMGTQWGHNFNIYKFKDNEMIKLVPVQYSQVDRNDKTFDDNVFSIVEMTALAKAPNPGFAGYSAEIVCDAEGKYSYLFPCIESGIGTGYSICKLVLDEDTLSWELIGSYSNIPCQGLFFETPGNRMADRDETLDYMKKWFDDKVFCWSRIGSIPCTYFNKDYTIERYNEIKEQLSDGAGSWVSGCYDLLSDEEKMQALIKSYNIYSIKEEGGDSQLYSRFLSDLKNEQ